MMNRFQSPLAFGICLIIVLISVLAARWVTGQVFNLTGIMDVLVGLIFAGIFAGIGCLTIEQGFKFKIFKERSE